jgi:nucleotide-binding universal stress UspA family protein
MKTKAGKSARLLLLVDASAASKRMVDYVAGIIGRRRNFHLYLLHLMPRMPAQLMETGGADTPKREAEVNAELHREQEQWIASKRTAARPVLDELVAILRKSRVSGRSIEIVFTDPLDAATLDRAVLGLAAERGCHTIALGHDSHSWFREMTGGHLTEHLLRHARGMTLWVVE